MFDDDSMLLMQGLCLMLTPCCYAGAVFDDDSMLLVQELCLMMTPCC